MDQIHTAELPQAMTILPGYSKMFLGRRLGLIVTFQISFCVVSSLLLSYLFYKIFFVGGDKSWKKSIEVMGPISKRLQNLEKERVIWNSYLEWIEDYCVVYYGLLSYLNTTVSDLDKLYREPDFPSEISVLNSPSETDSSKGSQFDAELLSELSYDGVTSEEDIQLVATFARVFASLHNQALEKAGIGDVKPEDTSSPSVLSLDAVSTNRLYEEAGRDELDSQSEDEAKLLEKKNVHPENRELQPVCEVLEFVSGVVILWQNHEPATGFSSRQSATPSVENPSGRPTRARRTVDCTFP